ncbi:hypothetical protein AB9F35_36665, partial [Rhizobium leguminosarum]|uniref:hypothetical protein n=1 Tax=Rhizobium leguminosarum TaxID=384 RepID=UPI003F97392E
RHHALPIGRQSPSRSLGNPPAMQKIFRRAVVVVPCIGLRNFPPSTQGRIANHPVFACIDKRRCLHLDPFNDP